MSESKIEPDFFGKGLITVTLGTGIALTIPPFIILFIFIPLKQFYLGVMILYTLVFVGLISLSSMLARFFFQTTVTISSEGEKPISNIGRFLLWLRYDYWPHSICPFFRRQWTFLKEMKKTFSADSSSEEDAEQKAKKKEEEKASSSNSFNKEFAEQKAQQEEKAKASEPHIGKADFKVKTKVCPYCAETVKKKARFCKFCQKRIAYSFDEHIKRLVGALVVFAIIWGAYFYSFKMSPKQRAITNEVVKNIKQNITKQPVTIIDESIDLKDTQYMNYYFSLKQDAKVSLSCKVIKGLAINVYLMDDKCFTEYKEAKESLSGGEYHYKKAISEQNIRSFENSAILPAGKHYVILELADAPNLILPADISTIEIKAIVYP